MVFKTALRKHVQAIHKFIYTDITKKSRSAFGYSPVVLINYRNDRSFWKDGFLQTVQTQIRLLLEEQSAPRRAV